MISRYKIGDVFVSIVDINSAIEGIKKLVYSSASDYVCVANVRTTVLAQKDNKYCEVVNNAAMNLPDGMPLVWAGKLAKARTIARVTGPDLFLELLNEKYGMRHFLLGDTNEVLEKMKYKLESEYEGLRICGHYSPPFMPFEQMDIQGIARMINEARPDIIWVALGAPKQDLFAAQLVKYLDKGIVIGVGAAFRFSLGEYAHPPKLIQKAGLEGVCWRFLKNPVSEFKWYMQHVPAYLGLLRKLKLEDA